MAMAGVGKRLELSDEDRVELERIVRAASSEVRIVARALFSEAEVSARELDAPAPDELRWGKRASAREGAQAPATSETQEPARPVGT
jgi:hypothetical protein